MTREYTPPRISNELGRTAPEAAADRNYYSRGTSIPAIFEIDNVSISKLVEEFGTPLFVFSEHKLREKARLLKGVFKSRYANTSFAWSYKTNYLNAICQILHQEGWIAEIVSDFEYHKARKLGIPGKNIVFNGPHKSREILNLALKEGALIQIDNWDELGIVEELVQNKQDIANVGIRIWLDAGIQPIWSKFGFALSNGEAGRAAERIVNNPNLKLHTLHTHIGTYILAPHAYSVATQKLLALREQVYVEHNHLIECINLGGGFPSHSLLHGMFGSAEQLIPPIESYADAITEVLNELPEKKRPLLRFETGRFLVDEAGYLLTNVVAVKGGSRYPANINSGLAASDLKEQLILNEDAQMSSYIIDAGINILYTGAWYQINVFPSRAIKSPPLPSRLYGPLCMAIDIVRQHVDLPPLKVNDTLVLYPVGAYNVSQSMQFITYRPTVVLIDEKGNPEIIRRREVLEDVDGPERMPEHLTNKP